MAVRWSKGRVAGVAVALAPIALLAASSASARTSPSPHHVGMVILIVGFAIGAINFYLSCVGPLIYRAAHRSLEGYEHVSGFPVIGTCAVVVGTLVGYGSALCATLGLVTLAIDTGGWIWFVIATWKDAALWE